MIELRRLDKSEDLALFRKGEGSRLYHIQLNPFFAHAYLLPMMAFQEGKFLGRFAAFTDEDYFRRNKVNPVFWADIDGALDRHPEILKPLMDDLIRWARLRGAQVIRGPVAVGFQHGPGLSVENGKVDEGCAKLNLAKKKDFFTYTIDLLSRQSTEFVLGQTTRFREETGVQVRTLNFSKIAQESEKMNEVYSELHRGDASLKFFDSRSLEFELSELKKRINPDLCLIAEVRDEFAGCILALSEGASRLIPQWLGGGVKSDSAEIVFWGARRVFRDMGMLPFLFLELFERSFRKGLKQMQISSVREDDVELREILRQAGAVPQTSARVFDLNLS